MHDTRPPRGYSQIKSPPTIDNDLISHVTEPTQEDFASTVDWLEALSRNDRTTTAPAVTHLAKPGPIVSAVTTPRDAATPRRAPRSPTEAHSSNQEVVAGLAAVLESTASAIKDYVHLTNEEQVWAITLWAAHTHLINQMDTTPRLAVKAPTRQSGKTRLLEVLRPLVRGGWHLTEPTAATLYRKIQKEQPTILFDEFDRFVEKRAEDRTDVMQVVNAGYRRGTSVPRCVGIGTKQEVFDFPVYSPMALAGIGTKWPDTVMDRSITILLQRKTKAEAVQRYRKHDIERMEELGRDLADTAARITSELNVSQDSLPAKLNDRAQDSWEGLLAIANLAGGDWPERAQQAAVLLSSKTIDVDDDRYEVIALRDARAVFANEGDPEFLSTTTIVNEMLKFSESPWNDERHPLNAHRFGKHLRTFKIKSEQPHRGATRGYWLRDITDQWERINGTDETPDE